MKGFIIGLVLGSLLSGTVGFAQYDWQQQQQNTILQGILDAQRQQNALQQFPKVIIPLQPQPLRPC